MTGKFCRDVFQGHSVEFHEHSVVRAGETNDKYSCSKPMSVRSAIFMRLSA